MPKPRLSSRKSGNPGCPESFRPLKALGPNSIHPIFYQKYWDIIGPNTIAFYKDVFSHYHMPNHMNTTFLGLVPKCHNVDTIKNFRPIGLCNNAFKLVTKIIINRLKPFLDTIIGPTQSIFLANRRVADNAIIVQEYLNHFRKIKGEKANMILKIDLKSF